MKPQQCSVLLLYLQLSYHCRKSKEKNWHFFLDISRHFSQLNSSPPSHKQILILTVIYTNISHHQFFFPHLWQMASETSYHRRFMSVPRQTQPPHQAQLHLSSLHLNLHCHHICLPNLLLSNHPPYPENFSRSPWLVQYSI